MSPTTYRLLANIVFVVHIAVIVYMLSSILLVGSGFFREHHTLEKAHFTFIGTVLISQIAFGGCPLVVLESALRHQYDPSISMTGSFTVFLIRNLTGVSVSVVFVTIGTYSIVLIALAGWVINHYRS